MSQFSVRMVEGDRHVFQHEIFRDRQTCERLLQVYRSEAAGNDWFASRSAQLADELEQAMEKAK